MPELHIITGSNGAGKSSIGAVYLPEHIQATCEVFNGDKLVEDKKKELYQSGMRAFKEARKIAHAHLETVWEELYSRHLQDNTNFAYEGHFTNEATWTIPRQFKEAGFEIHLVFLGLRDPDLSMLRVIDRSDNEGGHYVSRQEVEDNFYGNMEKLNKHYAMFDSVQIIDASESEHLPIATYQNGLLVNAIPAGLLPSWFTAYLPSLASQVTT
ncbi:zeta toxin family protein [Deminuibacter soli]|uniref:Zeta toxin domain-containing protein n=1 Tax=Deminuibacter soli TaxID=2291815 RepID=A0A3E1NI83_9BACT|nr:zeta toxin family protein [Deminuibacter soli]RFM27581.1 hypothetical protein DXN05_12740 [Deminuibacter soli]